MTFSHRTPPDVGRKVKIIQITDVDEEGDRRYVTDPTDERTMDWQTPPQTLIGQVGIVHENWTNDYYDVSLRLPWNADNEYISMKWCDIEYTDDETIYTDH